MPKLPELDPTPISENQLKDEYLSPEEIRSSGLLQEINRQFLHPRGLALAVHYDTSSGVSVSIGGIIDYRDEKEGVLYEPEMLANEQAQKKAERVAQMLQKKLEVRKSQGCDEGGVQPLGKANPIGTP